MVISMHMYITGDNDTSNMRKGSREVSGFAFSEIGNIVCDNICSYTDCISED